MANAGLHAAIGISIVKIIPIWWISLPLAFLSHFIMDLYPEASVNQDNFYKKENLLFTIIQFLLVLFVVSISILNGNFLLFMFAALIGNLPDIMDAVNVLLKRKKFWFVHGGNFPIAIPFKDWQGFSMKSWQNAILDLVFVSLLLLLVIF
jgi:hypothetical protein